VDPLVLIVDDDERNVRLARDILERDGLRTLSASTAAEAVALALEHRPDVILLDLRLPDLDGPEVRRRLADDGRTAAIPVVAWSALPEQDVGAWVGRTGFAGYLEKPIDVRTLTDTIRGFAHPG
jgi:two-component system, cell cycle response regulator DivK